MEHGINELWWHGDIGTDINKEDKIVPVPKGEVLEPREKK